MQCFKILTLITLSFLLGGCFNDDEFNSSVDEVMISRDTVFFDTVFSNQTTQTKVFTLKNAKNKTIVIKKAYLETQNSEFVISINGLQPNSDNSFENIQIEPNDSIFVFIKLNVPNENTNPFYNISDKLILETTKKQEISIIASIINAKRISNWHISKDTTLESTYSYLVMDSIIVDSSSILTLKEGVKFYMNDNSKIIVKGKLNINGTLQKPVIFQSNKIEGLRNYEDFYKTSTKLWKGIEFYNSKYSQINYANFLNADTTINCNNNDSIKISNSKFFYNTLPIKLNETKSCKITNSFLINSKSAFFSNNSKCKMYYNTIVNYNSNYKNTPLINLFGDANYLYCQNSIIVDYNNSKATFNLSNSKSYYRLECCILNKKEIETENPYYWDCLTFISSSILFCDALNDNLLYPTFKPEKNSIAVDNNKSIGPIIADYFGTIRNVIPDIGAIEYVE